MKKIIITERQLRLIEYEITKGDYQLGKEYMKDIGIITDKPNLITKSKLHNIIKKNEKLDRLTHDDIKLIKEYLNKFYSDQDNPGKYDFLNTMYKKILKRGFVTVNERFQLESLRTKGYFQKIPKK